MYATRPLSAVLQRQQTRIFLGIVLGALILRLALFIGYQGADDRTYIAYARLYAMGGSIAAARLLDPWIGRTGGWLPMALFMKAFGGAEWVLCLYSLLCSLGGIVLAYLLGSKLFSPRHGLLAALLLALLPLDIIYASRAFADEAVGFWCACVLTIYLIAERQCAVRPYFFAGLVAGVAYLTKETSVFLGVPLVLLMWHRRKLEWRKVGLLAAGFLVAFGFELVFWSATTGDPLYRWHATLGSRDQIVIGKTYSSWIDWIPGPLPTEVFRTKNSVFEAILMFATNEEFGFFYYLVWPIAIWCLWRRKREADPLARFLIPMALVLLFFPFHFPRYTLNRDPRYYTTLSVPAVVLLAWWTLRLKPWSRRAIVGGLILTWIPCLYVGRSGSEMGAQRRLLDFVRSHPSERIWLSSRHASDLIVLSHFDPALKLSITWLPATAPVEESMKRSSAITAMRPDLPVADTVADIRDGFVALPQALDPMPAGWRQETQLTDDPGKLTRLIVRILLACRVPETLVEKVVPSHGASMFVYWTGT
jgi:hypothetical protein